MKLLKVGAVVLGLHLVGFILVFVYPGCSSTPRQQGNTLPSDAPNTLPQDTQEPAQLPADQTGFGSRIDASPLSVPSDAAVVRMPPTRPTPENLANIGVEPVPTVSSVSEYTVVSGDSLSRISRKTGVPIDDIAKANSMTRNATLKVGQKLKIPGGVAPATSNVQNVSQGISTSVTPPVAASTSGGSYTVQAGDSLYTIAKKSGTTVAALRAANKLTSDNLKIGQRLTLPGGSSTPAISSTARPAPTPALSAPTATGGSHTVAAGETIGAIATRYSVSAAEIMRANNISDPRKLRVGQTLTIPGAAGLSSNVRKAAPSDAAPVTAPAILSTEPAPLDLSAEPAPMPAATGVLPSAEEEIPVVPVLPVEESNP